MSARGLDFLDKFSLRILKLLASNPLRSYYQREVAKKATVSVGKTNQVLRALEKREIVLKARTGKVDLYSYNLASPVARYLKILFNLSELNELLRKLRNTSTTVILFGSCAEGSDGEDSDIDMLVVTRNRQAAERAIQREGRSINRRISPVIVSPLEFSGMKEKDRAFYEQASKGIILWQLEE